MRPVCRGSRAIQAESRSTASIPSQIEQIRGVNSDSVIKNLLTKGLVEETGIAEGPGRPVLYATTPEFLQHFGLSALAELPALNLDEVRRQFASDILKG